VPIDAPVANDGTGIRVGRAILLGPGGSGKTVLGARLAQDWVPEGVRKERLIVVGPVPKLAELAGVDNHPVPWQSREKQDEFFRAINQKEGAAVVAVDEADLYYTGGGRSYGSKEFQEFINVGRNFGKGFILIARGDSDLATNTRGQVTVCCVFNTSERNLLRHAQEWFFDVPEVVDYITNLAPYEFMVWCPKLNPRWQGTGKVVNGQIYILPPETEPSQDTESEDEATSPDDAASTPTAGSSSPTGTAPPSAGSTTPSGSKSATG